MSNNNNHCDFSEELVSYLYGEIGAAEGDKFKAHLAQCSHCVEELAGFGSMRSSLAEWRQEEFSPMSAPAFELPVRDNPVVITDEPVSWLDGIRNFFTPRVTLLAGGFAAVVICLGLTFAFLNSQNSGKGNLVAGNSASKESKQITVPAADPAAEKAEKKDEVAKAAAPAAKDNHNAAVKTPKPVREYAGYQPKNNVAVNKTKQSDSPKLKQDTNTLKTDIYEDTEDDSLRLADLFAEADTN